MIFNDLLVAFKETILMTFVTSIIAHLIGIPLGIVLYITSKNGICKNKVINSILGLFINILRSIPCLLIIVISIPIVRSIVGIGTGEWYTLVIPLIIASFPFISRLVEQSLNDVESGVIEAAKSLGASKFQIIKRVLLVEARPALISGFSVATISILSYTSFAYDFSAGGLIAKAYQYYRGEPLNIYNWKVWIIVLILVVFVQIIQELCLLLARKIDKRRK